MNFKAYDLPHWLPVATELTTEEASRFDDAGFFVIPQLARLADYEREALQHRRGTERASKQAAASVQHKPAPQREQHLEDEPKPDYKAITREALRGHAGGAV